MTDPKARGFIPAYRKIYDQDHWLAPTKRDPSNRRDAWLDLCQMATHQPRETHRSGTLQRGELVISIRTMADRWCWSRSRVERFASELKARTAIETVRETPDGTVYRIIGYDTYTVSPATNRDTSEDTIPDRSETEARQEQKQEHKKRTSRDASPKRKTRLPDDWTPTDSHRAKSSDLRLDLDAEAEAFRDHHLAHGKTMADWDRAFHTWLRNAVKFSGNRNGARGGGHDSVRGVDGRRYIQ